MAQKTDITPRNNSISMFAYILALFYKQNPGLFIGIIISGIVAFFVPQLEALIGGRLIDLAINGGVVNAKFFQLLFVLIGIFTLSRVLDNFSTYLQQIFRALMPVYQSRILINKYLTVEPRLLEDPTYIQMRNKIDYNFYKISNLVFQIIEILVSLIAATGFAILIYKYNPLIVLTILFATIPGTIQQYVFGRRVWGIWGSSGDDKVKYQLYGSSLFTTNQEEFQEIKVFGYGKYLLKKSLEIQEQFLDLLNKNEQRRMVYSLFLGLIEFIFVGWGIYLILLLLFQSSITPGMFYFVYAGFSSLRRHLSTLLKTFATAQADLDLFQSFKGLLEIENTVRSGVIKIEPSKAISIEFKNVWFKYPKTRQWVLENLSFKIAPGENIALVGKNGAGKSTLIKLLLRVYDPNKGKVLINGQDIKEIDLDSLYRIVGVLSQNFNTFGIPADENIYLGDVEADFDPQKIKSAAKLAQAHDFIQKYPHRYNTYLSREIDGGIIPSGGQKQRLAIARVFFREPNLIILDEPTSAIDAIAEQQIFENIQQHSIDKTVLIVSHRFSTVKKAQKILVLDKGKIVEQGKHSELIRNNGLYREMYEKQVK